MNLLQDNYDNYTPFRCFRPRSVVSGGQLRSVGCYHCPACESSRMQAYARSIQLEAAQHRYSYFLTLTYDNSHLPTALIEENSLVSLRSGEVLFPNRFDLKRFDTHSVLQSAKEVARYSLLPHGINQIAVPDRTDLQKFLKRLRKYVSTRFEGAKIRFFAVCEYGPKSLRPHFHVCIFTNSEDVFRSGCLVFNPDSSGQSTNAVLPSLWPLGRVCSELSKGKCANYLSSYLVSSVDLPEVLQTRSFRPFVIHSQHFGFPLDYDIEFILSNPALYDKEYRKEGNLALGQFIASVDGKPPSFYRYPDSFYGYLLPALPYVYNMQRKEIYWLYSLFDNTSVFFPDEPLTRIADHLNDIYFCPESKLNTLYDDRFPVTSGLLRSRFLHFCERFRSYEGIFPTDWNSSETFKNLALCLLSVSRRVSRNACRLFISLRAYVDRIIAYYQCNEQIKLYNFYSAQEYFFNVRKHPISELKYFYDLVFTRDELSSHIIYRPSYVNFLRTFFADGFDNVKRCLKMLNIEHNSKLYDNNFVSLSCISDRYFQDWQNSVLDKRKYRMKHKVQNEIMFNFFSSK